MTNRRKFLAASSAGIATIFGGTFLTGWNGRRWGSSSNEHSPVTDGQTVHLEPIVDGFKQPLALENPIQDYLYIADKFGQIYLHSGDSLQREPVLDISDKLVINHGEQGLLGLAFHPHFESNRKLYVRYSGSERADTPEGYSHTFVLSEFRTTDDYREIQRDTERPILEIPEPGPMHNSGAIAFGPDGYLYVTIGDGGGDGHDGNGPMNNHPGSHAEDWYWTNVGGNGQDITTNLLGSVLRIDIDNRAPGKPYSVPEDNPLVDGDGLDEHYAWGFRNPYSMSFDEDDLYVTDVGTKLMEEVNHIKKGGNYGWNVREGSKCHNNYPLFRALSTVGVDIEELPMCPSATPGGQELLDPIIAYPHLPGGAIIGGHVYSGTRISHLEGQYLFGDLRGRLFAADPSSRQDFSTIEELFVTRTDRQDAAKNLGSGLLSIAEGNDGELYTLTVGKTGSVHRIARP